MKPLHLLLLGLVIAGALLAVLLDPPDAPEGRVVRYVDAPDWEPRMAPATGDDIDEEDRADGTGEPAVLDGLPLTVDVVDGTTGLAAPVRGVSLVVAGRAVPLEGRGGSLRLPRSPFHPGARTRLRFRIDPADGWVVLDDGMPGAGLVPDFDPTPVHLVCLTAEALRATLVVWPEIPLDVVVIREGAPVEGVRIREIEMGRRKIPVTADPTNAAGLTRLRGVPRVPGESLVVLAEFSASEVVVLDRETAARTVRLDLDEEAFSEASHDGFTMNSSIGIGGGGRPIEPERTASLHVSVLRHDGSPAAGVNVVLHVTLPRTRKHIRTDEQGGLTIVELPIGTASLSVREPGFLFGEAVEVWLPPGEHQEVTLREDPGRALEVRVVDHENRPVPGAVIDAHHQYGMPILAVEGGVQRLTMVTDTEGRLTLPRIPTEAHRVDASFGSRRVKAEAADGQSLLVLRLPEP